jgi:adenosylcobinamide-phosphate synthase
MGNAIAAYEAGARRAIGGPAQERLAGVVLAVALPLGVTLGTWRLLRALPTVLRVPAEIWLLSTALASRDLGQAATRVERGLERSLEDGRREVSMIVGRDTAEMDEADIVRATVETVAENTSDGVVAPLVFAAVGGAPLALGFKAVSTLDSMVGYKNERYRYFGWASARLDDAANLLPARLTAALATVAGRGGLRQVRRWLDDRVYHESPNAGLVEAAFAQALEVRLGGPARYGGRMVERPAVGAEFSAPERADIARVVALSDRVGFLALGVVLGSLWTARLAGARPWFGARRGRSGAS